MDELERFVPRIQAPPVISAISSKNEVFKAKRHNILVFRWN